MGKRRHQKASESDAPIRSDAAPRTSAGAGIDPELVRVGVRMLGYFSVFVVLTMLVMPLDWRVAIQNLTANISEVLIRGVGIPVTRQAQQLMLPGVTLVIDWACTSVTVISLYAALILAYQGSARLKATSVLVGTVVLLVANQLRIVAVALTAEYWPSALHYLHDYLFQVFMVIVAGALWMWWLGLSNREGVERG